MTERPCPFCAIAAGQQGEQGQHDAHVVVDTDEVIAFLDHRPVFKGHVLVVPRAHHETLPDLPAPLVPVLFEQVQRVCRAVVDGLGADGSFVAANNVVSQSVPHLHVHVVPRRRKDGLRGFFWPRQRYDGDEDMAAHAEALRAALGA